MKRKTYRCKLCQSKKLKKKKVRGVILMECLNCGNLGHPVWFIERVEWNES